MNARLIAIGVMSLLFVSSGEARVFEKQKGRRQGDAKATTKTTDATDIESALKGLSLTSEQKSKIADLVKEFLSGVNRTLTPEQQDQLKAALTKNATPKNPVENMLTSLSAAVTLTPEQELKIKPMIEDTFKALRDKTKGLDATERKQVTEQSMLDLKSAVRGILTAEQQGKLDNWKPTLRVRGQGQSGGGGAGKKPGKP